MRRISLFTGLAALSLAFAACNKTEADTVNQEPPKPAQPAAAEGAAAPAPDAEPTPAEALKAAGAALESAANAKGDTPCEQAYNGMIAMVESMSKAMGDAAKDTPAMPEKDKYMEACGKLPEDVQKCMNMAHAMQNAESCAKVMASIDPKVKAEMEQLMGK